MKNNDIRSDIVRRDLYAYEVAAAMNVKPNSLSHFLMKELTPTMRERIEKAIIDAERAKEFKHEH